MIQRNCVTVLIRFPTNTTQFHCQKASVLRDRPGFFAELLPDLYFDVRRSLPTKPETNKASACIAGVQLQAKARKIEREIRVCEASDYPVALSYRPLDCSAGRPTRCSVKEVIQPQVPLRLPCYDFAPVTALALGGSAPCGFLHRLRALTASMA